jgi:TldD protein
LNKESSISRLACILNDTCRNGADYSDLFIEKKRSHNVFFENSTIEEISSSTQGGTGTRIIVGENVAYTHITERSEALITRSRNKTLDKLGLQRSAQKVSLPDSGDILNCERTFPSPDTAFLHDIDSRIRTGSKLVKQVTLGHNISERDIMIIRNDNRVTRETRKYTTFTVQIIVEKDGILQTATESEAFSTAPEVFWSFVNPLSTAKTALERAITMIEAEKCPAGNIPVVLGGSAGGTMIHEACGHGLEADIMQKDFSVYNNRTGTVVASPLVTLVDDGNINGLYGSYIHDDEGNRSRRNILIENGILKGQLTDYMSSKRGGLPLSGNGRRSSYSSIPQPRMSNTFLMPGESEQKDIIGQVEFGLFVKKMGGGEVNPTSGDFVFKVTEGYIIQKGCIKAPVKGALLTGNGPQVLMDITKVGKDLSFSAGVCGKSGQNIPVTDGQPTILIKSLTVGGQDIRDESF